MIKVVQGVNVKRSGIFIKSVEGRKGFWKRFVSKDFRRASKKEVCYGAKA